MYGISGKQPIITLILRRNLLTFYKQILQKLLTFCAFRGTIYMLPIAMFYMRGLYEEKR